MDKFLQKAGLIGLIIILLTGATIGFLNYTADNADKKEMLTIQDVARTLKDAGFTLVADRHENPAGYKMGQALPSIYQVKEFDGTLFFYHFASIGERNSAYSQWEEAGRKNNSDSLSNMFTPKWQFQIAFAAKNTILVIGLPQFPSNEYSQKITPHILNMGKAVFYNLNEGKQVVYQGEGEYWKGKVIFYYYNHFWTDDKGVNRYDGWSRKQLTLAFKGDPGTIHGDFSYELQTLSGKAGGTSSDGFDTRQFAERESVYNYGGTVLSMGGAVGGSGGFFPQEDSVYTYTVKWNNNQETFKLKAVD
ncbi:MAG: hypothetical protein GX434_09420 [Peptococcaceae bacterium]|nr:hypothetical protein [Peptococcaceae bacterium]